MNKVKKIISFLSAVTILGTVGVVKSSAAVWGSSISPRTVSNGNLVLSDVNGYMMFDNDYEINAYKRDNFTLSLIAGESIEITNELLGISEEYKIEKSEVSNNVYVISFETEDEMNGLFEKSAEWHEKGIIKNSYKKMNIWYGCVWEKEKNQIAQCAAMHTTSQITYLVYNEEDVNGDSNGDGEVTANDAAYIARKLAEQNKKDLDYRADFNKSTDVTALDAAEIARYLAEKSINQ